jgi:hypothetical protein
VEGDWTYITTTRLDANATIQMLAYGSDQPGKTIIADAIKLTALVKERSIYSSVRNVPMGPVSQEDTARYSLRIENHGVKDLTISEVAVSKKNLIVGVTTPLIIPGMKSSVIQLSFFAADTGEVRDTLVIKSDDPRTPVYKISVTISVQPYFAMVDNEDSLNYNEQGAWAKSVAQAWGASSRFAASGIGASASFKRTLKKSGTYEVFEIVPTTVNSIVNALYVIRSGGDSLGSVILDQNVGSGGWTSLGRFALPANVQIQVQVIDNSPPAANRVVRADAIKFQSVPATPVADKSSSGMITDFMLSQNFPNPFNPTTVISYQLPVNSQVTLKVFDMLGREVATLVNEQRPAGSYDVPWNASRFASGVYLVRMDARPTNGGESGKLASGSEKGFSATKKIVLMK